MSKFKIGDKVVLTEDRPNWKYGSKGSIFTVVQFVRDNWHMSETQIEANWINNYHTNIFELYGEPKLTKIRPEDEVTITTTYGELARAYAVLGKMNGPPFGGRALFFEIENLIDPGKDVYDKIIYGKTWNEVKEYSGYQHVWLDALFNKKTENDRKLEALEKPSKMLKSKSRKRNVRYKN